MYPKRNIWLPKESCKEVEKGVWCDEYLKNLHETLKVGIFLLLSCLVYNVDIKHLLFYQQFRNNKESKRAQPKCLVQQETSQEDTEIVEKDQAKEDADEVQYQNTILIQKIIKGRAIQNMLTKAKKNVNHLLMNLDPLIVLSQFKNYFHKASAS